MSKSWVLVANQSEARIYALDGPRGPLVEVERLEHEAGHAHEGELTTDRPGRAFQSVGDVRHAMEPPVDPKEQEAMKFAKEVSQRLESGRQEGSFDRLVLVAAPHFLGLLRKSLSDATTKLVTEEIAKNLLQFNAQEIREHLPERL